MKNTFKLVLTAVITYIITRIIYFKIDFNYNLFKEGFEPSKILIDFAIYAIVFIVVYQCINFIIKGISVNSM